MDMNGRFSSNRSLIIRLVVIVVVVVAAYAVGKHHGNSTNTTSNAPTTVSIQPSGLKYPAGWKEAGQIPSADQSAGTISEASRSNPSASVVLLSTNGQVSSNFDYKQAASQAADKLKNNTTDFKLIKSEVLGLGSTKAIGLTFSDQNDGQANTHRQIILPSSKGIYYLTLTAKSSDYSKLSSDIAALQNAVAAYAITR